MSLFSVRRSVGPFNDDSGFIDACFGFRMLVFYSPIWAFCLSVLVFAPVGGLGEAIFVHINHIIVVMCPDWGIFLNE